MSELKGYERYQLEWMIKNGYSLEALFNRLDSYVTEECHYTNYPAPCQLFEEIEKIGLNDLGEMWKPKDMVKIADDKEIEEWEKYYV